MTRHTLVSDISVRYANCCSVCCSVCWRRRQNHIWFATDTNVWFATDNVWHDAIFCMILSSSSKSQIWLNKQEILQCSTLQQIETHNWNTHCNTRCNSSHIWSGKTGISLELPQHLAGVCGIEECDAAQHTEAHAATHTATHTALYHLCVWNSGM